MPAFSRRAKGAADIGGLAVKAHDIDGGKQNLLQIIKVIVRAFVFPSAIHDLGLRRLSGGARPDLPGR